MDSNEPIGTIDRKEPLVFVSKLNFLAGKKLDKNTFFNENLLRPGDCQPRNSR